MMASGIFLRLSSVRHKIRPLTDPRHIEKVNDVRIAIVIRVGKGPMGFECECLIGVTRRRGRRTR